MPHDSRKSLKKKHLLAIAAALLLTLLVLPKAAPTPAAAQPTGAISAPLETQPIVTQPTEPLLSEPQPTETVPLETELPGPPTCQPIFFSDALRAKLVFTHANAILSVI